jgi:hypothetical protein
MSLGAEEGGCSNSPLKLLASRPGFFIIASPPHCVGSSFLARMHGFTVLSSTGNAIAESLQSSVATGTGRPRRVRWVPVPVLVDYKNSPVLGIACQSAPTAPKPCSDARHRRFQ